MRKLAFGAILLLAACTTSNTMEGHQVRGTAEAPQRALATDLHASAPQWFKDRWRQYLQAADGGYAVLAADRNGRGTGYVYCDPGAGGLCDNHRSWNAAFKDTNYKYPALRYCANDVRSNYPAERPDCAVYAIQDKIVWTGPMPWE